MYYAYYSEPFNIIICLNGKVASTRVKEWLLKIHQVKISDLVIPDEYHLNFNPNKKWNVNTIHTCAAHSLYTISKENLLQKQSQGTKVIVIVRNPWHRLVSFYFYWVVSYQCNYQGLNRTYSFEDLVLNLETIGLKDSHVVPQFKDLEDIRFDAIIEMEHLASQFQTFLQEHTTILNHINPNFYPIEFFKTKTNCVQYRTDSNNLISEPWSLTGNEWQERKKTYTGSQMYNSNLIERVKQIYELDFKFLTQYEHP